MNEILHNVPKALNEMYAKFELLSFIGIGDE